jgi:serine/threonine-protein kinase
VVPGVSTTPVQVPGVSNAIDLGVGTAAQSNQSCALIADGTVSCWGPTQGNPASLSKLTDLAVAGPFACGRTATSEVWCWGTIGGASPTTYSTPAQLKSGFNYLSVDASAIHACAQGANSVLYCFGDNANAQYSSPGNKWGLNNPVVWNWQLKQPFALSIINTFIAKHNSLVATGQDYYGSMGDGPGDGTNPVNPKAITIPTVSTVGVRAVSAGAANEAKSGGLAGGACVATGGGEVYCWGANAFGEIGNGVKAPAGGNGACSNGVACEHSPVKVNVPTGPFVIGK